MSGLTKFVSDVVLQDPNKGRTNKKSRRTRDLLGARTRARETGPIQHDSILKQPGNVIYRKTRRNGKEGR